MQSQGPFCGQPFTRRSERFNLVHILTLSSPSSSTSRSNFKLNLEVTLFTYVTQGRWWETILSGKSVCVLDVRASLRTFYAQPLASLHFVTRDLCSIEYLLPIVEAVSKIIPSFDGLLLPPFHLHLTQSKRGLSVDWCCFTRAKFIHLTSGHLVNLGMQFLTGENILHTSLLMS